jgi:hypothetical protein
VVGFDPDPGAGYEATQIHHAARRHGGGVATRAAGAAAGDADDRFLGRRVSSDHCTDWDQVIVSWGAPQDVQLGPMHLYHLEAVVFS